MDKLTTKRYLGIDKAIHDKTVSSVKIANQEYEIRNAKNGMRYLTWDGKTFIQQDAGRNNKWGNVAKIQRVTRIMRSGGRGTAWGLIVDGEIELE